MKGSFMQTLTNYSIGDIVEIDYPKINNANNLPFMVKITDVQHCTESSCTDYTVSWIGGHDICRIQISESDIKTESTYNIIKAPIA